MSEVELYVRTERDAESYKNKLRSANKGLEKKVVVRVLADETMRLPAIRTPYNLYEGDIPVGKVIHHIVSRE